MRLHPKGRGRQACCQQTRVSLREGESVGALGGRGTGRRREARAAQGAEPGLQARADRARPPGRRGDRQWGGTGREPLPSRRQGGTAQPGSGNGLQDPARPPACRLPTPRGQLSSERWECKLCHGNSYRSHVAIHPHVYFERSGSE